MTTFSDFIMFMLLMYGVPILGILVLIIAAFKYAGE